MGTESGQKAIAGQLAQAHGSGEAVEAREGVPWWNPSPRGLMGIGGESEGVAASGGPWTDAGGQHGVRFGMKTRKG